MKLPADIIPFLRELGENNTKEWFDTQRKRYDINRADFTLFVDEILSKLKSEIPGLDDLKAKDCLFRINRDVRFSKNKAPYKTNFSAYFQKGGKKAAGGGFYLHIQPDASFVAAGNWMPEAPLLKKIRQEIDYDFKNFQSIVENHKVVEAFGPISTEDKLSRPPKDYDAENPAVEYLKLKSFVFTTPISDSVLKAEDFSKLMAEKFITAKEFIEFVNAALE